MGGKLVLAAAAALLCMAQNELCSVEGRVLNSATGEPLKKVQIILRPISSGAALGAVSDAFGNFAIAGVPPGRYMMVAERSGFVRRTYGSGASRGAVFNLAPGQQMKDAEFRMVPQALITGRVLDEEGEPTPGASVTLLRRGYEQGRRTLVVTAAAVANDIGEYRLPGLSAGQYYLSAQYPRGHGLQSGAADEGYVTTYYPNAIDPSAAGPIEVTAAAQLRSLDITLRRARTVRVSGRVTNPSAGGSGTRSVMVFLVPAQGGMRGYNDRNSTLSRDGRFEIRNVLPGSYLAAAHWYENSRRLVGAQQLEVGSADVDDVHIEISPGLEVRGRLRVEGGGEAPFQKLSVALRPANEASLAASVGGAVDAEGKFTLAGMPPGDYVAQVFNLPGSFYLKSVRLGDAVSEGHTVTLAGPASLELVLGPNGGTVEGIVDDEGRPSPGARVALVPGNNRRELYKSAATDQQGRFSLQGIAPGSYRLFAWAEVPDDAWMDPEFLKPFESAAASIDIKENGRETARLKLLPNP